MIRKNLRYTWNQKDWYRNIIISYQHRSEADSIYLSNMELPKYSIDRTPSYSRVWRFK